MENKLNILQNTNRTSLTMGLEFEGVFTSRGNTQSISELQTVFNNDEELNFIQVKTDGTHGVDFEIAFPILSIDSELSWYYVNKVLTLLVNNGCSVKKCCGVHVHIGLKPISANITNDAFTKLSIDKYRNNRSYVSQSSSSFDDVLDNAIIKDVVLRYAIHQLDINKIFPPSRTNNRFCQGLELCVDAIRQCDGSVSSLMNAIQRHSSTNRRDKFFAINLQSYARYGTIEFRQHGATLERDKVKPFVMMLANMFNHSINNRLLANNSRIERQDLPNQPFNPNSKLGLLWSLCKTDNGATTREIMSHCNIDNAKSVRRTISTIRSKFSHHSVECLTQQHYNHRYGTSNEQHDLNGYKIPSHIDVAITSNSIDESVEDHFLVGLEDEYKTYLLNRITHFS